jgi:hypothetical protein
MDITERYLAAAAGLAPGAMVHTADFSLFNSMSAVELFDPKLDSGMKLVEIQDTPLLPVADLSEVDLLGLLDEMLLRFALWNEGQSLIHTVYECVYIHSPDLYANSPVLAAFFSADLWLVQMLHTYVTRSSCFRDDDYAYAPIDLPCLAKSEAEVLDLFRTAERSSTNEAVLTRLRFKRALFSVLVGLYKPECSGFAAAAEHLKFAEKQFGLLAPLCVSPPPACFDATRAISLVSHFMPRKLPAEPPYTSERAESRLKSMLDYSAKLLTLESIQQLDQLKAELATFSKADLFTRLACDLHLYSQRQGKKLLFSTTPLSSLLSAAFVQNGLDLQTAKRFPEFEEFLSRVEIVWRELLQMQLKNPTRQRRAIWKYFQDLNILLNEAVRHTQDYVEAKIFGPPVKNSVSRALLFNWMFWKTMEQIEEYLRMGFEQALYSLEDVSMVAFYLDYLYGLMSSNRQSLYNFLTKKGKKKAGKYKSLEDTVFYCSSLQMLSRGLVRLCALARKTGALGRLAPELEAARYNQRFKHLTALQVPQRLEYESYATIMEQSDGLGTEELTKAAHECFDWAKRRLESLDRSFDVKGLVRVCVRNSMLLTVGGMKNWQIRVGLVRSDHPHWPVLGVA